MFRSRAALLVVCLILTAAALACGEPPGGKPGPVPAAEGPARTDRYGDPLPAGALARMGTVRFQCWGESPVALVQDGRVIASVGGNSKIYLWDAATSKELHRFGPGGAPRIALAASADGKTLASIHEYNTLKHNTIRFWDPATGKEVRRLEDAFRFVDSLALSGDGKTLAVGAQNQVRIWDVARGKVRAERTLGNVVRRSLALSPDGTRLAAGGIDKLVRLWDLGKDEEPLLLAGPPSAFNTVAFSPDSRILAGGGAFYQANTEQELDPAETAIRLWDAATGKELCRCVGHPRGVFALAFSPDGKLLASGGDGPVRLWDVASGKLVRLYAGSPNWAPLAFTPDGKTLVTGEGAIRLWDVATGQERLPLDRHAGDVSALALSPDGTVVASGGFDRTVRLWETATGRQLRQMSTPKWVNSLAFTPDGKTVISGGYDGVLRFWDVASGHEVRQLTGHREQVCSLDVSPDGTLLASAGEMPAPEGKQRDRYAIRLWDLAAGKELLRIGGAVHCRFAPDGKTLASSGPDNTVRLWDVAAGAEVRRFANGISTPFLAFAPDGKLLATTARDQAIHLWDTATSKEVARLGGVPDGPSAAAFSPDGRLLAAGNEDGSIRLWELISRQEICRFTGHQRRVNALQFTADGRMLVSAGFDGNLLVWDATDRLAVGEPAIPILTRDDRQRLWNELAAADIRKAHRAAWTLAAAGQPAVIWIREQLRPADRPEPQQNQDGPITHPETLRALRAVAVLERISGPTAREALEALAGGQAQARLTWEAKAALERLMPQKTSRVPESKRARPRPAPVVPKEPPPPQGPVRHDRLGDPLPAGALVRLGTVRWQPGDYVYFLGYTSDGKSIVYGGQEVCVWDAATGRERRRFGYDRQTKSAIALARDGRWLACAGSDGTIRLYEVATGKELRTLTGRGPWVYALALAPYGKTLVSAGDDSSLHFWDLVTGKQTRRITAAPGANTGVAFAPDGQTLASVGEDRVVRLWQAADGKELRRFEGFAGPPVFTPDGKTLAVQTDSGIVHLLDVGSGRDFRQLRIPEQPTSGVLTFSPDGKRLVAGSVRGGRWIWDVATGQQQCRLEGEANVVAFSPDGKVLISAAGLDHPPDSKTVVATTGLGSCIRRWDPATGKELPGAIGHRQALTAAALSPDGKVAVTADEGHTFRRWDASTGEELSRFNGNIGPGRALALGPGGALAATADFVRVSRHEGNKVVGRVVTTVPTTHFEGAIRLWDVVAGKELRQFGDRRDSDVSFLAFSPDAKTLVSGSWDSPLRLWEVATGRQRAEVGKRGNALSEFSCPVFSPDGKVLAAVVGTKRDGIILLDAATSAELRRMPVSNQDLRALAFSPDAKTLAVVSMGSVNQEIQLWELATGKERGRLPGTSCLALSPDGRMLAAAAPDNAVRLWEPATGRELVRLAGHRGRLTCLAFSADGRRLISGASDNTALVWEVATQLKRVQSPAEPLAPAELASLWADLADEDAFRAYRAVGRLTRAPQQAVALLEEKLHPATRAETERSLARWQALTAEKLQAWRALEVLEQIGSPAARRLLEKLAQGTPGAWLTQQAQAALARLAERPAAAPGRPAQ